MNIQLDRLTSYFPSWNLSSVPRMQAILTIVTGVALGILMFVIYRSLSSLDAYSWVPLSDQTKTEDPLLEETTLLEESSEEEIDPSSIKEMKPLFTPLFIWSGDEIAIIARNTDNPHHCQFGVTSDTAIVKELIETECFYK